jgi:F-type H+-transporting ATPase subunit b
MATETAVNSAGAATEAAGHAAASGGLPQFDFQWWPGQIAWVLLVFVVLFFYMRLFAVPKLGGAIAARDAKIEGDLADARKLKAEADATAEAAAADRAAARASAQKLANDARAAARAEVDKALAVEEARLAEAAAKADAGINAARDKAMTNVAGIAQDTAAAIVAKLTGKAATAAELSAARARG